MFLQILIALAPLSMLTRFSIFGTILLIVVGVFSGIASAIIALIGAISKKGSPPVYTTLIVKILSLPFYLFMCNYSLLFSFAMLNPFLALGIPFEIAIFIGIIYVYMLGTSLPLIIYAIVFKFKYKSKVTVSWVLSIIFLFFLVFDYVGAIIYMINQRKWFPEHFPPIDEAKRKKIRKTALIVIASILVIVAVLTTAFRLSSRGSALNLYSNVITTVNDNDLPCVAEFKDDENGYVIYLTQADATARMKIMNCYNRFVDEHPYYSQKMGTVTFVFYKYDESRGIDPVVIVTNGSKIE